MTPKLVEPFDQLIAAMDLPDNPVYNDALEAAIRSPSTRMFIELDINNHIQPHNPTPFGKG